MKTRTGVITLTHPAERGRPAEKLGTIHVLVLREDDAWCAIALEVSVRSYGSTVANAFATLQDAVQAQAHFTIEHGNWGQMFTLAETRYIELYFQTAAREAQEAVTWSSKAAESRSSAAGDDLISQLDAVEGTIDLASLAKPKHGEQTYEAIAP